MALRADFLIADVGFSRLGTYIIASGTGPLAYVSFGDNGLPRLGGYAPASGQTGLVRERMRAPVMSGEVHNLVDAVQVSIAAYVTADIGFWCNEIGLHFADGTMFAVGSKAAGFFYVNPGEERLVTVETGFSNIPVGALTLVETQPNFVIFNTGEQLNYTISVAALAGWNYGLEADAAITKINSMWGQV